MFSQAKFRKAIRFGWQSRAAAIIAGVAIGSPLWVNAQSARPDPADAGALAPLPRYQSAFSEYRPFREEKIGSWKDVNKEVADNPGMGSMKHGPGMTMPDMDSKTGDAPKSKERGAGHDMGSMKDMPGTPMPGMDNKAATARKTKEPAGGHDMSSMKDMPGMNKQPASAPMGKEGHGAMAMAKPNSAPGHAANTQTGGIAGTGVVQAIDKANGRVKLTHDPIAALGWPKMTMFFRLKDGALADQIKEGAKVEFSLEKSASGYVISSFSK